MGGPKPFARLSTCGALTMGFSIVCGESSRGHGCALAGHRTHGCISTDAVHVESVGQRMCKSAFELFEERAGILEHMANMDRLQAERRAWLIICRKS